MVAALVAVSVGVSEQRPVLSPSSRGDMVHHVSWPGARTLLPAAAAVSLLMAARPGPAQDPRPPAVELARALQLRYAAVQDFAADFVHIYEGGVLKRQSRERGKVLIKKPGKMKWTYEEPERKVFVSDGREIYSYIPADRQVMISPVPVEPATTPALFLAGKGDLLRDFNVRHAATVRGAPIPADAYALELTPKIREPEYETVTLVVDRKTLQLRQLSAVDQVGGRSTFLFEKLKENVRPSDKEFIFRIPKGVEVIRAP